MIREEALREAQRRGLEIFREFVGNNNRSGYKIGLRRIKGGEIAARLHENYESAFADADRRSQ